MVQNYGLCFPPAKQVTSTLPNSTSIMSIKFKVLKYLKYSERDYSTETEKGITKFSNTKSA